MVIKPGQTEAEAWQEHLAQHPEDEKARMVLFLNYAHGTDKTPGPEDP